MTYKYEQTKKPVLRRRNAIKTCKILDIQENNLIIRDYFDKENTIKFLVSEPDKYKIGSYVDMTFYRNGSTSCRTELIGHTPPGFVPTDGVEIGV